MGVDRYLEERDPDRLIRELLAERERRMAAEDVVSLYHRGVTPDPEADIWTGGCDGRISGVSDSSRAAFVCSDARPVADDLDIPDVPPEAFTTIETAVQTAAERGFMVDPAELSGTEYEDAEKGPEVVVYPGHSHVRIESKHPENWSHYVYLMQEEADAVYRAWEPRMLAVRSIEVTDETERSAAVERLAGLIHEGLGACDLSMSNVEDGKVTILGDIDLQQLAEWLFAHVKV